MNTQPQTGLTDGEKRLVVRLLGRFEVSVGAWVIANRQWRLRKSRNLVKLLALAPQHRLHDDRYEDWASLRRDQLHQNYLALLVKLAGLYEERAEYAAGIDIAARALASDPAHEEAHRCLMRLYARSDRRQPALQQYERL